MGPDYFRPDFILTIAIVLSFGRSTDAAAVIGFFAGLFHGAILNAHMAALIISRVLACVVSAKIGSTFTGAAYLTIWVSVLCASLFASFLYLLVGVPSDILGWLTATIGGAVYNAVLALPCYWLYRRLGSPGATE